MLREIGPPGIQNALHLLHKVVSLICTLITKYHFILSNLQRHNRQLGYWWRAWSRWMIWTLYSDRGELGPLPTSPQRTCPGWTTRTSIGKPKEWSTKTNRMRADWGQKRPSFREKLPENEEWDAPTFSDCESFLLKLKWSTAQIKMHDNSLRIQHHRQKTD